MIYAWINKGKDKEIIFKFNTNVQSEVEYKLLLMGYDNRDYFLLTEFRGNDNLNLDVIEIGKTTLIDNELNKLKLVCQECGSDEIEVECWVDANTNQYKSEGNGSRWCCECQENTSFCKPNKYEYENKIRSNN